MIDYSICPDYNLKKFTGTALRKWLEDVLNSVRSIPGKEDSSNGRIGKALKSASTPLYVTSGQYLPVVGSDASYSLTCINVNVKGRDYRLIIGYDSRVVKVEQLDAAAASHRVRQQAQWLLPSDAANVLTANDNARNVGGGGGGEDPYNNIPEEPYNGAESSSADMSARPISAPPQSPYGDLSARRVPPLSGH